MNVQYAGGPACQKRGAGGPSAPPNNLLKFVDFVSERGCNSQGCKIVYFVKILFYNFRKSVSIMANKMKLIIDTDPGVDDAMALGIALTWPSAQILAVTGVHGNISCEQACKNVLKILKVFGREDVLVYKGADSPIFGNYMV